MTQRYCLIGSPIDHSPSPRMHNAGFAACGIDAHYVLRPTLPEELHILLEEIEQGDWQGLNVTIPMKLPVAASIKKDELATRAGAVNTIFITHEQEVIGTNTDIEGVGEPLRLRNYSGGDAIIIGAGGAARAAAVALDQLGATIHVVARETNKASAMLMDVNVRKPGKTLALENEPLLGELFSQAKVIIQATPVGRHQERYSLPWQGVAPDAIAFEMLYNVHTPFLQEAAAQGCVTIEGWEMLLFQGMRAFEIWTRHPAPRAAMETALRFGDTHARIEGSDRQ